MTLGDLIYEETRLEVSSNRFVVCGHLFRFGNRINFGLCNPFWQGAFSRQILDGITQARLGRSSLLPCNIPSRAFDLACLVELEMGGPAY